MRKDMKKVLTERPRHGHQRCYREIRARQNRIEPDDQPRCQGMRYPYGWETKEFSDLLGPLRRFLWSCRGRRWDEVWSEICSQISNNTTGAHLKGHVLSDVEVHTYFGEDGKIFARSRYFGSREVSGLYVHPKTGILCGEQPKRSTWRTEPDIIYLDGIGYRKGEDDVLRPTDTRRRFGLPVMAEHSRKIVGSEQEALYIDGVWYWVEFATVPEPYWLNDPYGTMPSRLVHHRCVDLVTGKEVSEGRYRAGKRQMSATDLRRHGLINASSL